MTDEPTMRERRVAEIRAIQADMRAHPYREDAGQADQLADELTDLLTRICETCQTTFTDDEDGHPDNGCEVSGKNIDHPYLWNMTQVRYQGDV